CSPGNAIAHGKRSPRSATCTHPSHHLTRTPSQDARPVTPPPMARHHGRARPSHCSTKGTTPMTRTFQLQRDQDISGVSGTGNVADGAQFPDGTVALRWRGERASTVIWDSLDDALA